MAWFKHNQSARHIRVRLQRVRRYINADRGCSDPVSVAIWCTAGGGWAGAYVNSRPDMPSRHDRCAQKVILFQ